MRHRASSRTFYFLLAIAACTSRQASAGDCEQLSNVKLPNTEITNAETVAGGHFVSPYGSKIENLPTFCRLAGVITPSTDSYIRFEVWLPVSGWNHKYLGVGNGGFAGSIGYAGMANNLKRGYATAGTDTGHEGDAEDGSWAYKHPEKVIDFGYRALHLTTENAKKVVTAFYGNAAEHSYFDSCSDGGREALMEAQRFPEDFDGILAGAPANFWTHLLTGALDVNQKMLKNPAGYLSSTKLHAITAAALDACDAEDGAKDGIISEPERCHFNPDVLLCRGVETRNCLTAPQIASLKAIYRGGETGRGEEMFPGLMPGGEDIAWAEWVTGAAPGAGTGYVANYFRYMVFDDPVWNPLTANVVTAERTADQKTAHALNATDPNLHAFEARGGKLILYHGWDDPAISPLNTMNYYKNVLHTMGEQDARAFVVLYVVPGMEHCLRGPGPNSFGQLGTTTAQGPEHGIYDALEHWVEGGTAPDAIVATKYMGDDRSKGVRMTRPLCPYPHIAKYAGNGDVNDASHWTCRSPE
ncbi:MAG: tannase/feruloyl esterase family alpha/beta hydrolase [Acidobacteriaceae bacterium]|nr:tannase/feruloyl esterase family alpha/beta hydrolase [Acidobacteriaceae bacterium]